MAWSITVTNQAKVKAAIASIPDDAWIDIDYTLGGFAQVAETTYLGGGQRKKHRRTVRLAVHRTRLADRAQARVFPEWRHHSFITNRADLDTTAADRFHRKHAVRELKDGGAAHIPPVTTQPTPPGSLAPSWGLRLTRFGGRGCYAAMPSPWRVNLAS